MFGPFKKEKPLQGFMGFGGGAAAISKSGGAMAPQMEASGGLLHDWTDPASGNLYRFHMFINPGTFTVNDVGASDGSIHYAVVGGGGGTGRGLYAGGGGAGGMTSNWPDLTANSNTKDPSSRTLSKDDSFAVVVGRGGVNYADPATKSAPGNDSSIAFPFGTKTGYGGGGGGGRNTPNGPGATTGRCGDSGGCSGGGSYIQPTEPNALPSSQGYPGGDLGPGGEKRFGSGGGGLGGTGGQGTLPAPPAKVDGNPWNNGSGGPFGPGEGPFIFCGGTGGLGARFEVGMADVFGTPGPSSGRWFGGGGGGGTGQGYPWSTSPIPGNARAGGAGGGGTGSGAGFSKWADRAIDLNTRTGLADPTFAGPPTQPYPGSDPSTGYPNALSSAMGAGDGTSYTGGGAGGGGHPGGGTTSGMGGCGVAIIRYIISPAQSGTAKASGGMVSFYNGKTIHTFVTPGTFTCPPSFNETCEYACQAGGGGGGDGSPAGAGGGGGAGGRVTGTTPVSGPASLDAHVGRGGSGAFGPSAWWWYYPGETGPADGAYYSRANGPKGQPGGPSSVNFPGGTVTSEGGGQGGSSSGTAPSDTQPTYANCGPQGPTSAPGVAQAGPGWSMKTGSPGGCGGGNSDGPNDMTLVPRGSYKIMQYTTPATPGQGNNGGISPKEDSNAAAGGGGIGAVGGSVPNSNHPQTAGAGGAGLAMPTTFQNPLTHYGPGPSQWFTGGGGVGGRVAPPAPNPSAAANPQTPHGGGGGEQTHNTEGANNPPQQTYIKGPESGVMGTGSGGGGGCHSSPTDRYAPGGCGGDGIIVIAYPT